MVPQSEAVTQVAAVANARLASDFILTFAMNNDSCESPQIFFWLGLLSVKIYGKSIKFTTPSLYMYISCIRMVHLLKLVLGLFLITYYLRGTVRGNTLDSLSSSLCSVSTTDSIQHFHHSSKKLLSPLSSSSSLIPGLSFPPHHYTDTANASSCLNIHYYKGTHCGGEEITSTFPSTKTILTNFNDNHHHHQPLSITHYLTHTTYSSSNGNPCYKFDPVLTIPPYLSYNIDLFSSRFRHSNETSGIILYIDKNCTIPTYSIPFSITNYQQHYPLPCYPFGQRKELSFTIEPCFGNR